MRVGGPERTHTALAHAKINLVLRILSREAGSDGRGGYHNIETLFQRLALHDVVTLQVGTTERALVCEGPTVPVGGLGPEHQNLAWRAAEMYTAESGWDTGWHISIDKRIPVGGGLGGGSADAAAVLRAMEALSPAPLGFERLMALGGQLGADVPFFVSGASMAWAWGRGDRLLTLPALPPIPALLVTFANGVNTGAAYAAFAAHRSHGGAAVGAGCVRLEDFASWQRIAHMAMNDFEQVVPSLHEGVAAVLPQLRALANPHPTPSAAPATTRIALLSGSGATCFLLAADATSLHVPPEWQVTHTRTT